MIFQRLPSVEALAAAMDMARLRFSPIFEKFFVPFTNEISDIMDSCSFQAVFGMLGYIK